MLTAAGVGSGLDIESMITQIMALEQRPLNRLESSKRDVELSISANGQLRSAIARFQAATRALGDSETLGGLSASSSEEDVLTVSAASSADTQQHDIKVVQLATAHRLASNPYADADTAIGTGTLDITVGDQTLSLTLDETNNTLAQVRDAINQSASNPGITASIINVDAGSQLVLTANDTGTANAITVTPGATLTGFATTQVGVLQDAKVELDGFALTSGSNTITGAINGVTLNLNAVGSAQLSFSGDASLLKDALKEFVEAYNALRGNVKALRNDAFSGDAMLLGLERSINQRLSSPISLSDEGTAYLFEAGVSFTDQGDLKLDAAALASSVDSDPTRVLGMFAAGSSLATQLQSLLDGYLEDEGVLDARLDSLNGRERALDRQIASMEFRLEKTEQRLREQFTALDALLAQLTVTSDYLAQQLQSLPAAGGNGQ